MSSIRKNQIIQNLIQCIVWSVLGACIALVCVSKVSLEIKVLGVIAIVILMIAVFFICLNIFDSGSIKNDTRASSRRPAAAQRAQTPQRAVSSQNSSAAVRQNAGRVQGSEARNPLDRRPMSVEKKEEQNRKRATKLVLINEEGDSLLEWSLAGKTSMIIGKSTDKEKVDVDLECSAFAQMISKQHAVLNYTDGGWYVDDIDSKNGTRVKKICQNSFLDVRLVGTVEVEVGDIVYIANTMLQLQ